MPIIFYPDSEKNVRFVVAKKGQLSTRYHFFIQAYKVKNLTSQALPKFFTNPPAVFNIELEYIMKTQIIKINPDIIELDRIERIVSVLREEGLIVYPTETFYGLGVQIFSVKAIRRVYRLKQRDPSKPLPVVISDLDMLQDVAAEPLPIYRPLISAFWPGPLTVILQASSRVPDALRGPSGSIGIRLTGHRWLRALIRTASFPLTATSANISGEMDIADPEEAIRLFAGKVDLIVDGGKTGGLLPSTVVDLTGKKPSIIREGVISSLQLKKLLPILSDEGRTE